MRVRPEHLLSLVAVVEGGGVHAAARARHLSQPAVSQQLRRLEDAVGAPLFRREGRRLVPTQTGRALYRLACRVRDAWLEAETFARGVREGQGGAIAVAASRTTALALLPPALVRFHEGHPEVEVRSESGNSRDVVAAMARVDLGLIETPHPPEHLAGCERRRLGWDEVVALVPASDAGAAEAVWPVARLARRELVWREPGSGTREALELALAAAGVRARPRLCVGGTDAVIAASEAGLGVGIVSAMALAAHAPRGVRVVRLDPPIRRPIEALVRRDAPPVTAALVEALAGVARGLLRGAQGPGSGFGATQGHR